MEQQIIKINDKEFKQCPAPFERAYVSRDGWVLTVRTNGTACEPRQGRINIHSGGEIRPNARITEVPCEPYYTKKGRLCHSRKMNIGQAVLYAWVGPYEEAGKDEWGNLRKTVDHINHNPFDNRVENLRWASYKEQSQNTRKPVRLKDFTVQNDFEQFMEE